MTDHSLTLGPLLLTGSAPDPDHGYVFNVLAEGVTFGVAAGAKETVTSLLADGDLTRITRYGNREVSFAVEISGPDLTALAYGEAALSREIGKQNELVWQPPDASAPATAFEVVTSEMEARFNDLDEELRDRRMFVITLTCSPFAMSVGEVVIPAVVNAGTLATTNIDTCDSATNWTAEMNGVAAGVSTTWQPGAVSVVDLGAPTPSLLSLTRTASVAFGSQRYLVIEVGFNAALGAIPVTAHNGPNPRASELVKISQQLIEPGWFRCIYDTNGATISALTFSAYFEAENADLKIRNVARQNQSGPVPRQQTRIITPGGTERTPASIAVTSANGTDSLGLTLIHTCPEDGSGYSPPLRRWRTQGNTVTADSALLSGAREPLHPNPFTAEIPTSSLPEGAYLLAARLRCSAATTLKIFFSGFTRLPAPNDSTLAGSIGMVESINFSTANAWQYVSLGVLTLPTVRTMAGRVVVQLQRDAGAAATVDLDEVWLFRIGDDCSLTATDVPAPNLWADSPNLENPVPTLWMGSSRSTATHPSSGLLAMGSHSMLADGTATFVATTGTNFAQVSGTLRRRWRSNAAS